LAAAPSRAVIVALLVGVGTLSALAAQPTTLALQPNGSTVAFRAYAMGFIPLDGTFQRFQGTLTIAPTQPQVCHIDVQVEVASLAMDDPGRVAEVLSPSLLDAAHYPVLAYHGDCAGETVVGALTMHGETHPLTLRVQRNGKLYSASAQVTRANWGVTGRPLTAGATVRIRFTTHLP